MYECSEALTRFDRKQKLPRQSRLLYNLWENIESTPQRHSEMMYNKTKLT